MNNIFILFLVCWKLSNIVDENWVESLSQSKYQLEHKNRHIFCYLLEEIFFTQMRKKIKSHIIILIESVLAVKTNTQSVTKYISHALMSTKQIRAKI